MDLEQQQEQQNKPKILPLPNGPYYLLNDTIPKVVPNLKTSDGKPLSNISGTALCRCRASKNKPFCDGTHGTIRFLSDNKKINKNGQIPKDKKKSYPGSNIIIHDNRRICSHAGECVNNLSSVFRLDAKPWIDPNSASVEEIIQI